MYIIDYFFKKDNTSPKSKKISKNRKNIISEKVYLVINKNTDLPLGIYDNLEQAKSEGQTSTYHNCSILEFKLNNKCTYFNIPVFENK